jgi:hypothetical protein
VSGASPATRPPSKPEPTQPSSSSGEKESPLDAQQIRAITERLGGIAQRIQAVDADKKGALYEALGITVSYEHATRTRDRKVEALDSVSL